MQALSPEAVLSRVGVDLILLFLLGCGLLLRAAPASAFCLGSGMDLTYPGPAPCDTLQGCIDAEPCNGGIVEIASDEPIVESKEISFQKGLTLRAAPGFHPIFAVPLMAATPTDPNGKAGYQIDLEGLSFEGNGVIQVVQQSPSALGVELANDTFTPGSTGVAVTLSGSGGPIAFDISGNSVVVPDSGIGIYVAGLPPASSGRIADNTLVMTAGAYGSGILLEEGGGSSWSADVVANRVTGSQYQSGIYVVVSSGSSVTARLLDNLIVGEVNAKGPTGAIVLQVLGSVDATVVNNTAAANQVGVLAVGTGTLSGLLANNIVSENSDVGISIGPAFASSFANRNNLAFGGQQSFTPGPGTLIADPLFVGNGDYHLQAGSPAVDAGDDGAVPGDLLTDLDGCPRIQGDHVNLGAFETVPEPAGSATCGVTVLASVALLRHIIAGWRRRAGTTTL